MTEHLGLNWLGESPSLSGSLCPVVDVVMIHSHGRGRLLGGH